MYIKMGDKSRFSDLLNAVGQSEIKDAEELSYLLTMLTHRYLNMKPESISMYGEVLGALEMTKLELFRRHVALLENEKIKENGDI